MLYKNFRIPKGFPCLLYAVCCLLFLALLTGCPPKVVYKDHPRIPKVALVLGGGAARGYTHLGVLRVLEEEKIPIDMVVGTSAGSIVGAFYASGLGSQQIEQIANGLEAKSLADYFVIPTKGFLKGEKLENFLNQRFKNVNIEQLRLPFYAVAVDLRTGKRVILKEGSVTKAVRASCSVPGIFAPVEYNGMLLVDGGVTDQVPVEVARELGADIVIAVDISKNPRTDKLEGMMDIILASIDIMGAHLNEYQCKTADVVIAPAVGHIGSADFTKKRECILAGQLAAAKAIPDIYRAFDDYGAIAMYGKPRAQLKKK